MKKIIPFSKEIPFKTMIKEVTNIEVTHNLEIEEDNTIDGSFLVNGKYKMTDASQIEEDFNYTLPFTIAVDEKYDLENALIKINDFYFEIINEDTLKINIELEISGVEEKIIEERCYDDEEEKVETEMKVEVPEKNESKESNSFDEILQSIEVPKEDYNKKEELKPKREEVVPTSNKSITDIFSSINETEDTYKSYFVYIMRDNDTLDNICNKYNTTKENISEYNNIDEIKIGSKVIIPCKNE